MAALTLAAVSAALNLTLGERSGDQFRRDLKLANLIEVEEGKNENLTWPVKFSGRVAPGPKAEGYEPDPGDFTTHLRKRATLAWAEYFELAQVSGLAEAVAAANGGPGIDIDAISEEIRDAIDSLGVKVSQHTYSGNVTNSPTEIEGLARAVDATGSYANLAQGTYAEWASGENTLASAELSIDNLVKKLHRPFKDATGESPEFVMCPGEQWDAVHALFTDTTRQIVDVVNTSARGKVDLTALGGFRAILVQGVPYIEDRHCTASTFYALHSKWLAYSQVPVPRNSAARAEAIAAVKSLTGIQLSDSDVEQMLAARARRLQPTIEVLAKTGDSTRVMVKAYFQLKLRRRNGASKLVLT